MFKDSIWSLFQFIFLKQKINRKKTISLFFSQVYWVAGSTRTEKIRKKNTFYQLSPVSLCSVCLCVLAFTISKADSELIQPSTHVHVYVFEGTYVSLQEPKKPQVAQKTA